MKGLDIATVLRENWYLVLALLVCVGGGIYVAASSGGDEPAVPRPPSSAQPVPAGGAARNGLQALNRAHRTAADLARATIAEHEQAIAADPAHEDVPARLAAIGNLYRQKLLDYATAAQYYERLLTDHPDCENARGAYLQLATCYERLNDEANAQQVYQRMARAFPADSQEHQYALGRMTGDIAP